MILTVHKTSCVHCFLDEKGQTQGEFKEYWDHIGGVLYESSNFVDGKRHGEYKRYWPNGDLKVHCYYVHDEWHGEYKYWDSTGLVEHIIYNMGARLDVDPSKLSPEDKIILTIKYNIHWIDN